MSRIKLIPSYLLPKYNVEYSIANSDDDNSAASVSKIPSFFRQFARTCQETIIYRHSIIMQSLFNQLSYYASVRNVQIFSQCALIQDPNVTPVAMTHIIRAPLLFCQIFLGYLPTKYVPTD